MNPVLPLCFFALFCVILQKTSGEISPAFKTFLTCGAGILFFLFFSKHIVPVFTFVSSLSSRGNLSQYFTLLWKAMGIALLVSVSAGICRDLGEEGVAGKLEICGKALILSLSLPVLQKIMEFIGEMTG